MPFDPETGLPIEVDEDENGESGNGNENHNLKILRQQAKAGKEATDRADKAERELAVIKSGIDVTTPAGKLFLKAYDGDPTDVDALKEAAKEYEVPFFGDEPETPSGEGGEGEGGEGGEGDQGQEGSNGTDERSALANGAAGDTGQTPHPDDKALKLGRDALDDGVTQGDAMALYVASKAADAHAGDRRAIWTPPSQ